MLALKKRASHDPRAATLWQENGRRASYQFPSAGSSREQLCFHGCAGP